MTPPSGWLCDGQRPVVLDGRTHLYYLHARTNASPGGWDVCTSEDLEGYSGAVLKTWGVKVVVAVCSGGSSSSGGLLRGRLSASPGRDARGR